eukprot:TRINITY_DN1032_c0_g1_i1.p1 TRINITY_DN1032_c0_g1~~TRINITY_DN1032_c0_g1_i1.p1  ORF type:complete len:445 (-),score=45.73 TRINITY_DN1032_c0_g1_i1:929-2263(-)
MKMEIRFFLGLLLFLPIFQSAPLSCTTVSTIIRGHFDTFVNLQRRGVPTNFVMPFYSAYITSLDRFVAEVFPYEKAFGPVCLNEIELGAFHAFENKSIIFGEIEKLRSIDPQLFYLPPTMLSDSQLKPFTHDEQSLVDGAWDFTLEALEDPPSVVIEKVRSVLPPGLKILYDPEEETVCKGFLSFKQGIPEYKLVTSNYFIADVVATVIRAHLLGVPDASSLGILQHAVAFVFNGIRCERVQNEQLKVSLVYSSFYNEAFRNHTSSKDLSSVPQIPVSLVQDILDDDIRILSSFHSWGRLEHIFFDGTTLRKVHISEKIFSTEVLTNLTDSLSISLSALSSFSMPALSSPEVQLETLSRSTYTCSEAYFAHPSSPATNMGECCADICLNQGLYISVGISSTSECCGYCNETSCPLDESNPLSQLAPVHLEPYGYVPPSTTPIDI